MDYRLYQLALYATKHLVTVKFIEKDISRICYHFITLSLLYNKLWIAEVKCCKNKYAKHGWFDISEFE